MSLTTLPQMCQRHLSDADIRAIIKQRGFSREAIARPIFETLFLSDIGLDKTFASLTKRELACLHLLKLKAGKVNIVFFEALYGANHPVTYGTFTQRYTPIFKAVQQKLLRKGLLIISLGYGETKMEKWRFEFPDEFAARLPPLISGALTYQGLGETHQQWLRDKLLALTEQNTSSPFNLEKRRLYFNKTIFSQKRLSTWHQQAWHNLIWKKAAESTSVTPSERIMPLLDYALNSIEASQWFKPRELSIALRLYFYRYSRPNAEHLCHTGWQLGILARHQDQGQIYYRLAPAEQHLEPTHYLKIEPEKVYLDLHQVPFSTLETLAELAYFEVHDRQLSLLPNISHLGEVDHTVLDHPLTSWLTQHSKLFQHAFQTLEKKRGKLCLHENLYIAKVTDLSLRVQIQKHFSRQKPENQVIMLAGDFIAFPIKHLSKIEKLVNKSGYAVKKVTG